MRYRGESDIVAQLLQAASGGSTKTKLMYSAYLSFMQLKYYLKLLAELGLIECEDRGHIYRTTDKGFKFLKLYDQMGEYLPPVETRESVYSSH
jgi:predicted transcriptional regulator